MYQQTLSDYLGISSDISISFLDGVITSSVVKDRTVYLYPDYLSRNIEGFDSIEARSTIVSFFSKVTDIANDSNISEYEKSNKLVNFLIMYRKYQAFPWVRRRIIIKEMGQNIKLYWILLI